VKEAYNLFNEVADELFGPEDFRKTEAKADKEGKEEEEESHSEEEEDIDAAFDKVGSNSMFRFLDHRFKSTRRITDTYIYRTLTENPFGIPVSSF
jgi:hypothetical protein